MATYKGILTNNGKALIAGATVSNKINYSHIAVGDGNGSVPVPSETRTALINEKARIALNVVEINPNNTNQIVCEAIIPSNIGGFYIRELGLYAGNTMVVNASYPPTYKPLADEGAAREIAIKIIINIQNAEVIAMYLDDSLIYATREWVNNNYIRRNELIDNLVTDDASKPLTANQGKKLQDEKFAKTGGSVSGSVQLTSDNTVLTVGIDKDIGFVKKQGSGGVLAIAKDRVFRIVSGNKLEISADASDTFTDLLSLNGSGVLSTSGGFSGNAATASKWQTARTISYSGAATGSVTFDGSANASCILTLANSGVAAGTYASTIQIPQISVNAAGQITAISQQNIRSASVTQSGVVLLTDDLTTDDSSKALTAKQGKLINDKVNALTDYSLLDKFTIDLTALNKDTYYPVTTRIAGKKRVRFIIDTLFSSYQAPWSTHGGGSFSVFADWNEYPDDWGGNTVDRNINSFGYTWSSQSPILGISQMGASSNAVFYARGGTKYDVYVAKGCTPIIRTASYSLNGETVQPIAYNANDVPRSIRQQLSADKLDKTATAVAAKKLAIEQTSFSNDSDFIQYYKDKSTAFFDNGSGKFLAQYAAGLVSSQIDGGTFIISTDILTGRTKLISCVVRTDSTIDYLNKKEFAFTDSDISGNSASSTKLKNTRKIFGLDFDGTNDVTGNITTTTGMVASDSYHYIDMGRPGVDRMNLAVYGGIFNFINAENGNVIARLNSNGIDCNAATATKLQNSRAINGVTFDGTQAITITAEQKLNGGIENESQLNAALTAGVYVCSSNDGLAGIYGYGFLQVYRSGAAIAQVFFPHLTGGSNDVFFAVRQSWDSGQSWGGWYYSGKNADSASKLKTARNIAITGAVSGSGNFDGSGNLSISTILNNFGSLKEKNGYKYLGDGLILQWGTMDYTSYPGETKVDITFPITFPNNVLNINSTRKMAQHSASGDGGVLLISQSNSGASFSLNVFNSNSIGDLRGFTWFAIGF
ncbi:phage tail protein [Acinetobacter baumannii]|uniref:phage tail-collar fiber domain-containing protein n=1 Tax=Acinetobacter baumannii TaxID=470 RepID=UPI001F61B541|nr:phage tail protein [Acinetobacter baumannii]MCI3940878.1 phage tail protein [Acinetobacter baumannii]